MRIFITLILFILTLGCDRPSKTDRPVVLTTIPPYAFFVERIAGDTVKVETLVPPWANPHLYEPTLSQVDKIGKAQIWLLIGEPMEEKIYTVLTERNPELFIVRMTRGIDLLDSDQDTHELGDAHCTGHHHDGKDNHIWMSPRLAQKQAVTIARSLMEQFPEHAQTYHAGLENLLKDLAALDQEIHTLLAPYQNQAILVSHPAFGYFCKDYRLIQLSIECEGKEPLPNHISEILRQARSYKVKSVLTMPQYNNKGAALIAKELHLPVHMVDPYSPDYLENLRSIAKTIAETSVQ